MKLQFLGTAAAEGIPALFCPCPICAHAREKGGLDVRTRSGALVDGRIKIDFPPDTYAHILRYGIHLYDIRSLLITHTHFDHFSAEEMMYRMPAFANLPEDAPPLTVYGNAAVDAKLNKIPWSRPGRIEYHELKAFQPIEVEDYRVTALPADHMKDETCFIYSIEKDGRRMLYGHDTGFFPESTWEWLTERDIHLVSLDCTCGGNDHSSGHMGFPANVRVRDRMLSIGAAGNGTVFVSNHFSHNGGATYDDLTAMARPEGFLIAYDGMELEV